MPNDTLKNVIDSFQKTAEITKEVEKNLIRPFENNREIYERMMKDAFSIERTTSPIHQMEFTNPNMASEFRKRLIEWVNEFDESLDHEHEVGIRLVNFGQTVTFHLDAIGYYNPSLISFSGFMENGDPVELIQHVSQISVLLMKMKRPDPTKPKRTIGFFEDSCKEPAEKD